MVRDIHIGTILNYNSLDVLAYSNGDVFNYGDIITVVEVNKESFIFTSTKYPNTTFYSSVYESWSNISNLRKEIINEILK